MCKSESYAERFEIIRSEVKVTTLAVDEDVKRVVIIKNNSELRQGQSSRSLDVVKLLSRVCVTKAHSCSICSA